ncbi:MAG TPA: ATP synthase F1 subunit gamma [Candidatus Baltobacteraceae bacterium]|nr:ATP synthase F1 subunit gamma [Candidatus Baltobacteraceae bacterium]
MASVKELRARIRSLKSTQQITKAMKQIAAAKIRRAEQRQKEARPYAEAIGEMLRDLIEAVGTVDHPFMRPGKEGAPRGIVLLTSDRGLAGAFNSNLVRSAEGDLRGGGGSSQWYTVGNKGRNAVRRLGQQIALERPLGSGDKLTIAQEVAARAGDDFASGKLSEVVLISSRLITHMTQRPERRTLLPLAPAESTERSGARAAVEFLPSPEFVLTKLLPKYLEFTLYSAMLETDAAYFSAQLVAMTNATDNADDLIDQYTLEMNKARQAAITKEMLEIVGGAEAVAAT